MGYLLFAESRSIGEIRKSKPLNSPSLMPAGVIMSKLGLFGQLGWYREKKFLVPNRDEKLFLFNLRKV